MHDYQLNSEQREAVETLNGPILVLSGAGSGKTRVVTCRIAHLLAQGVDASSILGLTFTNKAAEEMKARVHALAHHHVLICTFHSLGARILRESIHLLGYNSSFTIYDEQDTEKLMKVCLIDVGQRAQEDAKNYLNLVSKAKNAMQMPEDCLQGAADEEQKIFAEVYRCYQAKLQECNAVDFDDLLFLPVKLFQGHPEALHRYQQRWSFLMIDEYQDTNAAQYSLVRLLVAEHHNLCVVGDPDQSIYSWRGADINNILNFELDYPGAKVVRLEQNYRSRSNILEAANAVVKNNDSRYEKKLWSDRGPGEKIRHFTADTEKGEAEFISEKIHFHYSKHDIPLKHMAVLYRTNAQSRALEDRLLIHRIPYVIVGGISFYQRREIKDILAFLRMVQSGVDFVSFMRTINIPKRGIGETTIEKIRLGASQQQYSLLHYCQALVEGQPLDHPIKLSAKQKEALASYLSILHALREINQGCSLKELVKRTIEQTGYLEFIKGEPESYQERKENLNALISKATEWEASATTPSLEGFLEELSLKSSLDEADTTQDRIRLMTVHNGKGLEFDVVIIAGLEEDLFPHANSRESETALEEERRLCYVGMTRAKEYLYLCDVRQRLLWGTTRTQRPSRFLREIPSEYLEKIRPSYLHTGYQNKAMLRHVPVKDEDDFIDDIDQTLHEFEAEELNPGDAVFHQDFGIGKVTHAYHGSAGLTYKIIFSKDNRERSLVAKMARLQKV